MASKLQILIETLYKGKGAQQAKKDMKGLDDATTKGAKSQTSMKDALGKVALAAGAVGGALFAAKKAFDFGAEGAQILRTRDVFDRLTESIDATASVVLGKMRDATMGMVSDSELMRASARTMSMGLASSGDEVAKLAEIAVKLGAAMGKEAGPAMEEFGLLLANTSTLRLDTFGISAGKVKARIIELRDATPGLSREAAFMTATMEQAEISMDKLGDAMRADSFSVASAEAANLTDELKVLMAEGLAPLVSGIAGVMKASRELREVSKESAEAQAGLREHFDLSATAMMKLERAILNEIAGEKLAVHSTEQHAAAKVILVKMLELSATNANLTWEQLEKLAKQELKTGAVTESLTAAYAAMAKAEGRVIGSTEELAEVTEDAGDAMSYAEQVGIDLRDALGELGGITKGVGDASDWASIATDIFAEAEEKAKKETEEFDAALERHTKFLDDIAEAALNVRKAFGAGTLAALDAIIAAEEEGEEVTDDWREMLFRHASQMGASEEAMIALGLATGNYTQAQLEAAIQTEAMRIKVMELGSMVAEGIVTSDQALDALETFGTDGAAAFDDVIQKAIDLNTAINDLPDEKRIRILLEMSDPNAFDILTPGSSQPTPGGPPPAPPPTRPPRPGEERAQHGLHMTVPPGFNNDSFPIWTSSGEPVDIWRSPQERAQAMGGGGIVVNVYTGSGNPDLIGSKVAGRVAEVLGARG